MRYFENAFKFTFKNFVLALPMIIAMAIPALIMGVGSLGFLFNMGNLDQIIKQITDQALAGGEFNFGWDFYRDLYGPTMIISMIVSGLLSLVLTILVMPITFGLINKKYETGNSNLSDMTQSLSKYIGRYVLYLLLNFAIGLGAVLVLGILIGIAIVITITVSKVVGGILIFVFAIATIVGLIALHVYMSLWFTAVCVEDSGIVDGLKNSFKYVRGSFWTVFGITLLISLCGGVASLILGGVLGWVPVVGSTVGSVVTTLAEFIAIVFYFEIYREKSGRFASPEYYQQLNGNI